MIIVDFAHLCNRMLFSAQSSMKPSKDKDGKLISEDFFPFVRYLIFKALAYNHKKFGKDKEMIIALEGRVNWRKDFYSDYKANRKTSRDESPIRWDDYYRFIDEIIDVMDESFPYRLVQNDKAEGDDVIAVLAQKFSKIKEVVVISSDKDFKQLTPYAKLFDPMKKKFINMSEKELKSWKTEHILLGDSADNVPTIKHGTEFSPNFISYLKENEIFVNDVKTFNELSISEKLYEEYDVFKKNKKGEDTEKDIFKMARFGPAGAKKFAEDLKNNLLGHPMYIDNFKRNQVLVLFDHIPDNIQEDIMESYNNSNINYCSAKIMKYFQDHNLIELLADVQDFMIDSEPTPNSLDTWLDDSF